MLSYSRQSRMVKSASISSRRYSGYTHTKGKHHQNQITSRATFLLELALALLKRFGVSVLGACHLPHLRFGLYITSEASIPSVLHLHSPPNNTFTFYTPSEHHVDHCLPPPIYQPSNLIGR
jgi:hypothetical protein